MSQGSRGGTDDLNERTGNGWNGEPNKSGTPDEENEYQTDTQTPQKPGDGYDEDGFESEGEK